MYSYLFDLLYRFSYNHWLASFKFAIIWHSTQCSYPWNIWIWQMISSVPFMLGWLVHSCLVANPWLLYLNTFSSSFCRLRSDLRAYDFRNVAGRYPLDPLAIAACMHSGWLCITPRPILIKREICFIDCLCISTHHVVSYPDVHTWGALTAGHDHVS